MDGCVRINTNERQQQQQQNVQVVGILPGMPSWVKMGIPPLSLPLESSNGIDTDDDTDDDGIQQQQQCYRAVQPVILQGKPDFNNNGALSVLEHIAKIGLDTVNLCIKERKKHVVEGMTTTTLSSSSLLPTEKETTKQSHHLLQFLAEDFASLLTLTAEQCSRPPSELSPSGQYLFGIACACMIRVAPSVTIHILQNTIMNDDDDDDNNNNNNDGDRIITTIRKNGIPYPILLFDELFDTESSSTVELCGGGISNLIRAGGVAISATHRPGYFSGGLACRTVTLSGGKVLLGGG